MSSIITADQIRALWDDPNPHASIDRGDSFELVTKEDLGALASGLDTDDDGYPLEGQWELLADQLNSATPGEPTSTAGAVILQEIVDARLKRDRDRAAAVQSDDEFNELVRAVMRPKRKIAPVAAIEEAAQLSRARLYQIRDGRR